MQPSIGAPSAVTRAVFYRELHQRFARQEFDNWVVWAGNDRVVIGGVEYASTLARAYTAGIVWRAGTRTSLSFLSLK